MNGIVTMSKFGRLGRFGNQIFQYMFMADYGKTHNLEVQVKPWVGDHIFAKRFKPLEVNHLPVVVEQDETPGRGVGLFPSERAAGIVRNNVDYQGYAQYHTSYYAANREYLTGLMELRPEVTARMADAVKRLQGMGDTIIGVHLRRGDYGRGMFYITPTSWYIELLETLWQTFDNPVLFIATEDLSLVRDFDKFRPQTTQSLGIDLRADPIPNCEYLKYDLQKRDPHELDWVPDWVLLRHCNSLLIPNSTFSFSASMFPLNKKRRQNFKSSLVRCGSFMFAPYTPWNAQPLTYTKAEEYPDLVSQITVPTNPYWKN